MENENLKLDLTQKKIHFGVKFSVTDHNRSDHCVKNGRGPYTIT